MTLFLSKSSSRQPALLSLILLVLLLSLTGCSYLREDLGGGEPALEQKPVEEVTMESMNDFNVGKYQTALKGFQEIMDRFPFSEQAMLAELKAADCHYYLEQYPEAKALYQEFKDRHPTNESIPYVMFQSAMCDFNQTDRIDRNISSVKEAIQSFSLLLRTFPDSPYTYEAKARLRAAQEFLVNHEFFVAVFYVRTKRYSEAAHRLKYILKAYPDSQIIPKAKGLLEKIETGNPPKLGLSSWLPDLSMPDYHLFGDSDRKESNPPAQ